MAVNSEKIYNDFVSRTRSWDDFTPSEQSQIKSYIIFKKQKTSSVEQPLGATPKGRKKLAAQNAAIPPAPKEVAPKTFGTQLDEALTRQFPKAYPAAEKIVTDIASNPFVAGPLGMIGAGATSLQDITAQITDPTNRRGLLETTAMRVAKQIKDTGVSGAEYLRQKGVAEPKPGEIGLGNLKDFGITDLAELTAQGLGGMQAKARPALDITKNIYAQSAMATRGLPAEVAKQQAEEWVRRNPNWAGSSSNILGSAIDPLNIPVGKALSTLRKAVPTPPVANVPTSQTQIPATQVQAQTPRAQVLTPDVLGRSNVTERIGDIARKNRKNVRTISPQVPTRVQRPEPVVAPTTQAPTPAVVQAPTPIIQAPTVAQVAPTVRVAQPTPTAQVVKPLPEPTITQIPKPIVEPTTLATGIGEALNPPVKFTIPKELSGSKPTYNYGSKGFKLDFASDIDKALYIVAESAKRSKSDAKFIDLLINETGLPEDQLRALGQQVRDNIKKQAAVAQSGTLKIPDSGLTKPKAIPTTAPTSTVPVAQAQAPTTPTTTTTQAPTSSTVKIGEEPEITKKAPAQRKQKQTEDVTKLSREELSKKYVESFNKFEKKFVKDNNIKIDKTKPSDPRFHPKWKDAVEQFNKTNVYNVEINRRIYGGSPNVSDPNLSTTKSGETISSSENVPKDIVEIAQQWARMLGIKEELMIFDPKDLRKIPLRYANFKDALFEASIDKKVNGVYGTDGTYHAILLKPQKSKTRMLELLSHEMGHMLMETEYRKASQSVKDAIDAEYAKWYKKNKKSKTLLSDLAKDLRAYKAGKSYEKNTYPISQLTKKSKDYMLSKSEWFADQVARWATTSDKPLTVVEKFFSRLAKTLKQFFQVNKQYLPSKTMEDWLNSLATSVKNDNVMIPVKNSKTVTSRITVKSEKNIVNGSSQVATREVPEGIKSPNDKIEATFTSTINQPTQFQIKTKEYIDGLKESLLSFKPYAKLNNLTREFFFETQRNISRAADSSERVLKNIYDTIRTPKQKEEFERYILIRDLYETTEATDVPIDLPNDLTKAEVDREYLRLKKIAEADEGISQAISKYDKAMKDVFDSLLERGVLPPEAYRKGYFPHHVLKYAQNLPEVDFSFAERPRGYAFARKSSTDLWDSNVENVLRRTLTKVTIDNASSDGLSKILNLNDTLSKVDIKDILRKTQSENVVRARKAMVPDIKGSEWREDRIKDLTNLGMTKKEAKEQARIEWRAKEKSMRINFYARRAIELKKQGVPKENIPGILRDEWKFSKTRPEIVIKDLDNKTVMVKDVPHVFFQLRGKKQVFLIPKTVADELKQFGEPLHGGFLMALSDVTGVFKATALTITTPARLTLDIMSNAAKLAMFDIKALRYVPRAMRIMMQQSDYKWVRRVGDVFSKLMRTDKETLIRDADVAKFLKKHGIIEPLEIEKGMFRLTSLGNRIVNYVNPVSSGSVTAKVARASRNLTQRADEFFRTMKVSADYDRIYDGKNALISSGEVKSAGIIDVGGLDPEYTLSKVGHEFFVDPTRQSRTMRKWFTRLLMPFLNWPAVDTLHMIRYITANQKNATKAAAYTAALVAGFQSWNNTGDRRKVEEMLPPEKRQIPHFITGYEDEEGNPYIVYLPVFPGITALMGTGLARLPQNVVDYSLDSTIPGKQKEELGLGTLSAASKQVAQSTMDTLVGMANPFARTAFELGFNKSLYTDKSIVKPSEEGTTTGFLKQLDYALNQTTPPYRIATTTMKENAKEAAIAQESNLDTVAMDALVGSLDIVFKRVLKKEDLKKMAQSNLYDLKESRQLKEKNPAYEKIRSALPKAIASKNYSEISKIAKEYKLTRSELNSVITASSIDALRKLAKDVSDPADKARYQELIKGLERKQTITLTKQADPTATGQGKYFYDILNSKGEK